MSLTNHEFVMNGKLELNDFPTADNDSQIPDDFLARSKNDIGPVTPTCGSSDKDVARNRLAYISFFRFRSRFRPRPDSGRQAGRHCRWWRRQIAPAVPHPRDR